LIQNNNMNNLKEGVSSVFQSIAAAKNALTSVASLAAPLIEHAIAELESRITQLEIENQKLREENEKLKKEKKLE